MTKTELERITRLETELEHMSETVSNMARKVDAMHDLLLKARGAQWAFYGMAGLIGFATSKLGALSGWFGALPR